MAIRYIEKRRESTCLFADKIGKISIDTYRRLVPQNWRDKGQTCVATFVCVKTSRVSPGVQTLSAKTAFRARVVALGVGTKFCSTQHLRNAGDGRMTLVRDCHAEILACRALRRALLEEMLADVSSKSVASADAPFRMLTRVGNGQWQVHPGVTFHMYCSSAPCGNSTIRRWARGGGGGMRADLGEWAWPNNPHPAFHAHAKAQGQCALLVKRDASLSTAKQFCNTCETHDERSKLFLDAIPPGLYWAGVLVAMLSLFYL